MNCKGPPKAQKKGRNVRPKSREECPQGGHAIYMGTTAAKCQRDIVASLLTGAAAWRVEQGLFCVLRRRSCRALSENPDEAIAILENVPFARAVSQAAPPDAESRAVDRA